MYSYKSLPLALLVLPVFAGLLAGTGHAAGCGQLMAEMKTVAQVQDAPRSAQIYIRARTQGCPSRVRGWLGTMAANSYYRTAFATDMVPGSRKSMLREGLKYGRPWYLLAALADIMKRGQDFTGAALLYNEALDSVDDVRKTPVSPSEKTIRLLHKKAETSWLLAPGYVALTDRNGVPGGVLRPVTRGIGVRKIPVPVRFKTNEARFTVEGGKAIDDMFAWLRSQKFPDIALVGHTDERGSGKNNQLLSRSRAQAVRDALKNRGYKGRIRVSGKGETSRFIPDNRNSYTREQQWQMDRRVELVR